MEARNKQQYAPTVCRLFHFRQSVEMLNQEGLESFVHWKPRLRKSVEAHHQLYDEFSHRLRRIKRSISKALDAPKRFRFARTDTLRQSATCRLSARFAALDTRRASQSRGAQNASPGYPAKLQAKVVRSVAEHSSAARPPAGAR